MCNYTMSEIHSKFAFDYLRVNTPTNVIDTMKRKKFQCRISIQPTAAKALLIDKAKNPLKRLTSNQMNVIRLFIFLFLLVHLSQKYSMFMTVTPIDSSLLYVCYQSTNIINPSSLFSLSLYFSKQPHNTNHTNHTTPTISKSDDEDGRQNYLESQKKTLDVD